MSLRYADRQDVLEKIAQYPDGITAPDLTSVMWPDRKGYDYTASKDWVKKQIQVLRRRGLVESVDMDGMCYLWRIKA